MTIEEIIVFQKRLYFEGMVFIRYDFLKTFFIEYTIRREFDEIKWLKKYGKKS